MKLLASILLSLIVSVVIGQTDSTLYSFFIAGHTCGQPGINNTGFHPPFKMKFEYIQNRTEIKFGVLTGDIVIGDPTSQDWDEIDAEIDTLGLPVYFAVGNHDMEDRPLFESRYGITYYHFIYENDLFIILDPNIDGWSITGIQKEFLENTVYDNYQSVSNIFVFFHQLLWWDRSNIYADFNPNTVTGRIIPVNFWTDIEPLFNELPNPVIFCAGDMGSGCWCADFIYDSYDNISFVGSGMGESIGDNFIVINVAQNKSITYDLICLNDSTLNCFGELTDYQLSPNSNTDTYLTNNLIYPNPATNYITIEQNNHQQSTSIQILNINGQLVMNNKYSYLIKQKIDISHLHKGLYVLKITNDMNHFTYKLIIQ